MLQTGKSLSRCFDLMEYVFSYDGEGGLMPKFSNTTSKSTYVVLATIVVVLLPHVSTGQSGTGNGEWQHYAGNAQGMKYSPLSQIDQENINDLEIVWVSPSPDLEFQSNPVLSRVRYQDTPLMVNGRLYSITGLGIVIALDPATGERLWI